MSWIDSVRSHRSIKWKGKHEHYVCSTRLSTIMYLYLGGSDLIWLLIAILFDDVAVYSRAHL